MIRLEGMLYVHIMLQLELDSVHAVHAHVFSHVYSSKANALIKPLQQKSYKRRERPETKRTGTNIPQPNGIVTFCLKGRSVRRGVLIVVLAHFTLFSSCSSC